MAPPARSIAIMAAAAYMPVFATGFAAPSGLAQSAEPGTKQTAALSKSGADLSAWAAGYTNCPKEVPPTVIPCSLPADFPVGTYFRNGHGRFTADDGTETMHMFDGDGLMNAVTFDPANDRILFRNKFVETMGYMNDKRTGKMSQRGIFGTMRSGGIPANAFRMDFKNVANTNAICAGGNLYALWEGGRPYVLDPLTLKNKYGAGVYGEDDMDGLLGERPEFSAHPRWDPKEKVWVNFGLSLDPISGMSKVQLYELDSNFRPISTRRGDEVSFKFCGPGLLHDFLITENYYIFALNQAELCSTTGLKALLGMAAFAETIKIDEGATETVIALIPRMKDLEIGTAKDMDVDDDERIIKISVPFHFSFHFSNAFEDGDGNIILETVQVDEPDLGFDLMKEAKGRPVWTGENLMDKVFPSYMVRYSLNVETKAISVGFPPKVLTTRVPEFPQIPRDLSTRRHRYSYTVASHREITTPAGMKGSGPPGAVMKIDAESPETGNEVFEYEPYEFPGEVAFVPKVGADVTKPEQEDKGYLVLFVSNPRDRTSDLVVLDVEGSGSLSKGPVLRVTLPTFIPHGLHGGFADGVTFDFDKVAS